MQIPTFVVQVVEKWCDKERSKCKQC